MAIIRASVVLLLFQAAGTLLKSVTRSPLPGPLMGMVLLALWLGFDRKRPHTVLQKTADGLLRWLALFFVPAGAGVLGNLVLLRTAWFPLAVGLVGSTFLTVLVTALVMHIARGGWRKQRDA